MDETTTHTRTTDRRALRRLRRVLALLTVTAASVLLPVGAASARIEPGPAPSRITYQMPATPVQIEDSATSWGAYAVPVVAIVLVVALMVAVWFAARRHHTSGTAAVGV